MGLKTIEWLTVEKYEGQRGLPKHKQIPAQNFIDWAQFGAREAQRWISIDEEMPSDTGWMNAPYLVKTKNEIHVVGFTEGCWHMRGGLCLKKNTVTHWRPIERE